VAGEKRVFVLKHVENEDAGTIADFMKANAIPFEYVNLYAGGAFPDLLQARAVIAMGGPMNVDEEARHPFLKTENKFIQEAGKRGIPYLGVCLGSQLLAKAFGGRVYKAGRPEVGWGEVTLTRDGAKCPLFAGLKSETLPVLQWHEDTFDIPQGGALLASNPVVPNQALSVGERMFGFQFHVEVNQAMLENWFAKRADKDEIVKRFRALEETLKEITGVIYRNFFSIA
jgi:GMP synthase-like glutamine amidotransferase